MATTGALHLEDLGRGPLLRSLGELEEYRQSLLAKKDPARKVVSVCTGTGCRAYKSHGVAEALRGEIEKAGLTDQVELIATGCHGFCERGPLMVIYPEEIFYQKVTVDDLPEVVSETLAKGEIVERLLYVDPNSGERRLKENDILFYKHQQQELMHMGRLIDPRKIEDYIAHDGYAALAKGLGEMEPDTIIDWITKSGLRGRGGGGFPTGVKWAMVRKASGAPKYVVCNADEGDPGAYMDRSLLEGNPHRVIEGMLIAAFAIGATQGYVYVRNEYPLAVSNLTVALDQARSMGLLGDSVLGADFGFDIGIVRGGGAFVCGEETGLIASVEGRVGEPRVRPPYPAQEGLWGKPTNLNNVETYANVPLIVDRGVDWYTSIGTGDVSKDPWGGSKGTKIFSLVGKVNNTGLVEVPMGITLREIVYDIGGGMRDGKAFKAVQTGGPSGGCLPASLLDQPVDFEGLAKAGSMMGSGGMIAMDEDTCMVDFARYFLNFLRDESCGKCTTCREGIKRMWELTDDICEGRGTLDHIQRLERLAKTVAIGSLCALGQTAPNPVLSTLRYFRDEYLDHVERGECPAKVCKPLIHFHVNKETCTGCNLCLISCPYGAITGEKKKGDTYEIDQTKCEKCRICYQSCKFDAIDIKTGPLRA